MDEQEYVEIVRRKSPKKRGKKSGKDEKQETDEHLVGEGAGTSYQTMDPTPQQTQEDATDGEVEATGAESAPTSGDERGAHKMSAFTTLLGFLTKQSYIVGLILMMAWSIIYLSWITFVLLLWALLIWIVPISTTRNRCLYTSPLLVFYAEAIIIITFVYGLETNLPEKASGIDLKEVGLRHYKYPFIPLLVEMAFTLMFWLTLRQFLREQKLRRHNVDEGIVLQPFGVIFSGPEEEVMSTDVDGHHLHRGHSVTMTFLGQTLNALLAKYWILLCGLMFLIISLQGTVDIFKTIYMLLFLILLNIFMLSFTLFRFILRVFGWIVVLYSMAVLCMIYTYQFTDLRNLWINNTFFTEEELAVLGLQKYDDLGMLITNLLIPTAFIILVMIQLHYFHHNFISISNIKSSGYRPGSLDEDGGSEKKTDDEGSPAADAVIEVDETDKNSISSKKSSPTTGLTWKLKLAKAYHLFNTYLGPCQVFLWRLLEVHIMKLVFLTIILVVTKELTAVNGILLLIIFLPIAIPSLHRVCCMMSMLWVSVVLLGKMVFQLDYSNWFDVDPTTNCTENPDFPIQDNFFIPDWFGFKQVGYFYNYVEGYVAIIIMLIIYSIVMLHQQQYRNQRGLVKPDYSIVFNDITRECADKDGLPGCIKFLINYCFYKFGLEICFTTTVIVAAVRLDVFAFIFLLMMVPLLFIKRRKCAILWPLYMLVLIFLFPVAYALALGLPPVFCIDYPWTDVLPARLNTWLYLSNYLTPRDPNPSAIVADFFQLLFVCLQWQVFRVEKNHDIITGGGDNYELSVDVERIDLYPVPNFTFNRLDDLNGINVARLVVPDVILLVVSVMVFLSCKYILTPPQTTQSASAEHGEPLSPVMERRPRRTSVVVEGLRSCNIMIFCALSGIILPSAISAVYFVSFLVVVTWWSFYQSWGRVFKSIELLWLIYSGAHVIILYIVQFQFFQELVPYDSDEGLNVPALVGLTPIIDSLRCDQGDDPRKIAIADTAGWTTLVNPWIVFLFYWFLGHEVQRWFAGPWMYQHKTSLIAPAWDEIRVFVPAVGSKSWSHLSLNGTKIKKLTLKRHQLGNMWRLSEGRVQRREERNQEKMKNRRQMSILLEKVQVPPTRPWTPPLSRPKRMLLMVKLGPPEQSLHLPVGMKEGAHKMSAFTTLLGFLTKQSYIVGLILMMAWSIIYLSWITFVLLLWALLIWIVPISTTRNRCLYTSPLLVFYAEAIIIITFVYGLETNLPEKASGIDLKEVGLRHYKYPFIPLLVEMAFTLMFWLTLRQFLREQKLRRHNVDEGIVLQPFGVIFSGPEEEVMSTDVDGHHLHRGHSVTMTFLGQTLNALLAKYWILLCGLMFLIISLQGTVDIFKTIYMLLFLILLNIFMLSRLLYSVSSCECLAG
nr:piezo-type mechanosensitive ion channel component 2-like [Lytechinus pictus]